MIGTALTAGGVTTAASGAPITGGLMTVAGISLWAAPELMDEYNMSAELRGRLNKIKTDHQSIGEAASAFVFFKAEVEQKASDEGVDTAAILARLSKDYPKENHKEKYMIACEIVDIIIKDRVKL